MEVGNQKKKKKLPFARKPVQPVTKILLFSRDSTMPLKAMKKAKTKGKG